MVTIYPILALFLMFVFICQPTNGTYLEFPETSKEVDPVQEENSSLINSVGGIKCPRNEHFSHCGARCQKNCTNINNKPEICVAICVNGCVCNKGLARGATGQCIKPKDCSKVTDNCPPGQHFDQCFYHCQRNCSNWNEPTFICTLDCIPGCVCDEGTIRESFPNGRCIKPKECRSKEQEVSDSDEDRKCPPNSHFTKCVGLCPRTCANFNENPAACETVQCTPGCVCNRGFVKGFNGRCILPKDCPKETGKCPPGQHFDDCGYYCQRNCSTFNDEDFSCIHVCEPVCACDEGTVRESTPDGRCIKPEECPTKNLPNAAVSFCPPNEEYSKCESHCERNCKNMNEKYLPCIQLCVPGCVCKYGFVRGPNGRCIETRRCPIKYPLKPPPKVCPRNEIWSKHFAHCQKNCSTFTDKLPCLPISVPGCICRAGWVRGTDGKCIMPKDCPKEAKRSEEGAIFPLPIPTLPSILCGRNEIPTLCYKSCPDDCTNYMDKTRRCLIICIPKCVCVSGYVRGPDGNCIKPNDCPKEKKPEDCTELEYYDTCGSACQDNCTNYNLPEKQCDKRCVVGCFCLRGYVRGPKGDCIWPFDCVKSASTAEESNPALMDDSTEQWRHTTAIGGNEDESLYKWNEKEDASSTVRNEQWPDTTALYETEDESSFTWNEDEDPSSFTWNEDEDASSTVRNEQRPDTSTIYGTEDESSYTWKEDEDASPIVRNEMIWDEEEADTGGCPDSGKCDMYCAVFLQSGNCGGKDHLRCICL